jgi:hypothetical protein
MRRMLDCSCTKCRNSRLGRIVTRSIYIYLKTVLEDRIGIVALPFIGADISRGNHNLSLGEFASPMAANSS